MKKSLSVLLILFIASAAHAGEVDDAMKELSAKIIASYRKLPDAKRQKFVAVMDFQNRSMLAVRNNLGVAFSEILAQYLLRYRGELRIIERKQIESIIREKELKMTGIAEGGDASSYGEVLGADLLIIGSVFDAAGEVRVNVRVVETGKSEVLLNESVTVDRGAFVKTAKRYVKVTHTVSAGYMHQYIDDYTVNTYYAMYNYNFYYGLALGFQVFYGYSTTVEKKDQYENMGVIEVNTYEKSFQQFGMNILFSKGFNLFWGLRFLLYGGPSMVNYADKTELVARTSNDVDNLLNQVTITPSYFLFGGRAGLQFEYSFSMSYKFFIGCEYQYFPEMEVQKVVGYETPAPSLRKTVQWNDNIKFTGYSLTAGVAYSF